jgi:hypothetical protein
MSNRSPSPTGPAEKWAALATLRGFKRWPKMDDCFDEIEALVRAVEEIDFVFAKGPLETVCHRNDFRGLTEALDALNLKLSDV